LEDPAHKNALNESVPSLNPQIDYTKNP